MFRDNCLPIVEAGQALLVDDGYQLDDLITLTPTPGHSPCHCCVNIFSGGQRAVVTGDMMHHTIQCRELSWSPGVDWDPYRTVAGGNIDLPLLDAIRTQLVASGSIDTKKLVVFGYSQRHVRDLIWH